MRTIAFHLNCLTHGGTERVVSNLANSFAASGYMVYVVTEWQAQEEFPLDDRVQRIHVGLREEDEHKGRITRYFLRIRYLKKFLKEYHPDILVSFMKRANFRALMATRREPIPVVVSIRNDPEKLYRSFFDRTLTHLLFPRAAGAVCQTRRQREYFGRFLPENTRVILNPINEKYLDLPIPEKREPAVVHAARLVAFKDQATLIKAFIRVHERHPGLELRMYGPDSGDGTKELCESLIRENNAQDWIHLLGDCDELERVLPVGLCFVSSSIYEGLPNSVLEALAMGLPVVSTDCPCGGPAEVIRNGENGLLVPVGDVTAIADAITRLVEDREFAERLGAEARKIAETANTAAISAQWREYLEQVITEYGKNKQRTS